MSKLSLCVVLALAVCGGVAMANWQSIVVQAGIDYFTQLPVGEAGLRCFGGNVPFAKTKCRGWIACRQLQQNCKRQCEANPACRGWTTAKVSCWKFGDGARCERGHKKKYVSGFVNH